VFRLITIDTQQQGDSQNTGRFSKGDLLFLARWFSQRLDQPATTPIFPVECPYSMHKPIISWEVQGTASCSRSFLQVFSSPEFFARRLAFCISYSQKDYVPTKWKINEKVILVESLHKQALGQICHTPSSALEYRSTRSNTKAPF
jgi:hypothetical protein